MDSGLAGTTALVTGASGGIGLAIARSLAAEGVRLALHYHRRRGPLEALLPELRAEAVVVGADLRDEGQADAAFAAAVAAFGRIDALVVNAGVWEPDVVPLHQMTLRQWRDTMAADLDSAFLTCRAFLRHVAQVPREEASIVLIGSTAALFGEENHGDYAAAKAAMAYGLTRTLKNEIVRLAPRGRVNAVCPGWVATPMSARAMDDPAAVGVALATMPVRKVAAPDDVAAAVVFLSSPSLAGHISGAIVPVAGGMEGRLLHPA